MQPLTSLELAAISAIVSEMADHRAGALKDSLAHALVISRENTGGGFFSNLQMDTSKIIDGNRHLGDNVWIAVDGLKYGLGMILHLKDEQMAILEGYAVGPEDTSNIAFDDVRFAVVTAPGSLPATGG